MICTFVGVDRNGRSRSGAREVDPVTLTRDLYDRGYRSATVRYRGRVVGEVVRNLDRVRVWYADPDVAASRGEGSA